MSATVERAVRHVINLGKAIVRLFFQNQRFVNLLVLGSLAFLFVQWYYTAIYETEFYVLAGPPTSAGKEYSEKIQETFNESSFFASMRTRSSEGFIANHDEISADKSGRLIGFGQLGFGEPENLRVLLPLESDYLHIICRTSLFAELQQNCEECLQELVANKSSVSVRNPVTPDPPAELPSTIEGSELDSNKVHETVGPASAWTVVTSIIENLQSSPEQSAKSGDEDVSTVHQLGFYELLYAHKHLLEATHERLEAILGEANNPRELKAAYEQYRIRPFLRVAAGKSGSGSQFLAKKVLSSFDIELQPSGFSSDGRLFLSKSLDLSDAFVELVKGEIDVIFYLGPTNTEFVKACKNHSFLLSLGDHAADVASGIGPQIMSEKLSNGIYGTPIKTPSLKDDLCRLLVPSEGDGSKQWCLPKPSFCEDVVTIKSRRALLCSKYMTTNHAYEIASAARSALSEPVSVINWKIFDDVNGMGDELENVVVFHDGALILRDGGKPGIVDSLVAAWGKILPVLIVTIVALSAGRLDRMLSGGTAPPGGPGDSKESAGSTGPDSPESHGGQTRSDSEAESASATTQTEATDAEEQKRLTVQGEEYGRIKHGIESDLYQLQVQPFYKSEKNKWKRRLDNIEQLIEKSKNDGTITDDQAEALMAGCHELNLYFEKWCEDSGRVRTKV